MGYSNYDDWKLANPYDECEDEYVPVEVEVEIYNENKTSEKKSIQVDVLLTCDDWEKECYVEDEDVENAVAEYLGNDCEYEILNWEIVRI